MRVEEILDRLERVRRNGHQWLARCPAHEDRSPSLSIRADGDVILLHCFAGCHINDICRRLHIEVGDLFNRPLPRRSPPMPIKRPDPKLAGLQEEYVQALLADEKRLETLHRVRCWTPTAILFLGIGYDATTKRVTFPARVNGELRGHLRYSPIGDEPKMIADPGLGRALFPEFSVLPATGPIWIVEGEPDAVAAWSRDRPAVGVPGVEGWKASWAPLFAGRDVGVIPDDDEPGRRLAEQIERDLLPYVASIAVGTASELIAA